MHAIRRIKSELTGEMLYSLADLNHAIFKRANGCTLRRWHAKKSGATIPNFAVKIGNVHYYRKTDLYDALALPDNEYFRQIAKNVIASLSE